MSAPIPVRWRWLLPQGTADAARMQRALELIQWLAFACMLADHVGYFVLGQQVSWLRGVGRLTFPLFALVFGWRLADAVTRDPGRSLMAMQARLLLAAVVAQVLFVVLFGYGELLNILFSFAAALAIVQVVDGSPPAGPGEAWRRALAAAAVLAAVGVHADYGASGVAMIVSFYAFFRSGSAAAAAAVVVTVAAVSLLHPQHWGLLALPLAAVLLRLGLGLGRPVRHLFYWLYPGHLFLVYGLRALA